MRSSPFALIMISGFAGPLRSALLLGMLCAQILFSATACQYIPDNDEDDEDTFLATVLAAVTAGGPLYLFSDGNGGGGHSGSLGGRAGLDSICAARKSAAFASLACTNVRAWISVTAVDSIQLMPVNYNIPTNLVVLGPTGTQIGNNWNDLLDGSVSDSGDLKSADLFSDVTADPPYYWTGSASDSGSAAQTCGGWTLTTGNGETVDSSNNGGFSGTEARTCNSTTDAGGGALSILCVCF